MRRSEERILTTHTGSLPRPAGVPLPGTAAAASGASVSEEELRQVVADTVRRQVQAGVDVVNDGEVGKPSYATYVVNRLTGFDGTASQTVMLEEADGVSRILRPVGPIDLIGDHQPGLHRAGPLPRPLRA